MGRGLAAAPLLNKLEVHHPLLEVKVGALPSTLSVPAQLDGGGRWGMDLEVGARQLGEQLVMLFRVHPRRPRMPT
jgi:hypothetical protein